MTERLDLHSLEGDGKLANGVRRPDRLLCEQEIALIGSNGQSRRYTVEHIVFLPLLSDLSEHRVLMSGILGEP
jgi:hypothetical protein